MKDALVVIDLGRGWRKFKKGVQRGFQSNGGNSSAESSEESGGGGRRKREVRRGWSNSSEGSETDPSRAWRGSQEPESPRLETGTRGNGVLSDDEEEVDDEGQTSRSVSFSLDLSGRQVKTDERLLGFFFSRYSTFYPHRQSQRFPPRGAKNENSDTEDEG